MDKTPIETVDFQQFGSGTYAEFDTTMGTIVCRLFTEKSPITCENFIGLANGTKEFRDPQTGEKTKKRFYDGSIFHRVIPNFMIQGGCPLKNGRGGPGYTIKDEFDPSLKFDRVGLLAMANTGHPNSGGCQFFITEKPTPWLNNKHTIFGEVVLGKELIPEITKVPAPVANKPTVPVVVNKLNIVTVEAQPKKKTPLKKK